MGEVLNLQGATVRFLPFEADERDERSKCLYPRAHVRLRYRRFCALFFEGVMFLLRTKNMFDILPVQVATYLRFEWVAERV